MHIRDATYDDIKAIQELWKEFIDFHAERDTFFTRSENAHRSYGIFTHEKIDSPVWLVIVAEVDAEVVGYAMGTVLAYPSFLKGVQYGYIEDVAVTASQRGQGIGRRLFERLEEWFREQGITRMELRIAASNEVSRAFWERLGFTDFVVRMAREI